jgi:hypothetical protein
VGSTDRGADMGGANDERAGLARVGARRERRHPNWGRVRSGGGGCR